MNQAKVAILTVILLPYLGLAIAPIKAMAKAVYYALMLMIPLISILVLAATGVSTEPVYFGPLIAFSLERYSFFFVLLLNLCWIMTIIYSIDYIRYRFYEKKMQFYGWMFVAISVISATALAENLFTLLVFYTLAIPVVYPLIILAGSGEAKKAGRSYLLYTLLPLLFILLPTFMFLNHWFSPLHSIKIQDVIKNDFAASLVLAATILGFSKCCLAPFFPWLPQSAISPAPISALIHSVGSVHTGTIAVLKISLLIFGQEYLVELSRYFSKTGWLIYLCGFTAIYTAIKAYQADNLKMRFSYSTVGQLSYILIAILIGTSESVLGGILHIFSHTIAKMNLFFIVGAFASLYGTVSASEIRHFVPHTRWLAVATGISGLSIAGVPLLAGYYSKDLILLEGIHTYHYAAVAFLVIGSILNFLYIFPVLRAAVLGPKLPDFHSRRLPLGMAFAIITCSLLIVLFSWYLDWIVGHLAK